MKEIVRKGCLYPIIKHIPLLRPVASLLLDPTVRRITLKASSGNIAALQGIMKRENLDLDQAYKFAEKDLIEGNALEHLGPLWRAYKELKKTSFKNIKS